MDSTFRASAGKNKVARGVSYIVLCSGLVLTSFSNASLSRASSLDSTSAVPLEPQQTSCNIPDLRPARPGRIDCQNTAAPDGYVLALSWSPQYCASAGRNARGAQMQCQQNRFGFVVHGLWPQISGARGKCGQPRNCGRGEVDNDTMLRTVCIMPSPQLIQDQWEKHGSCSGLGIPQYFSRIRSLYTQVRRPDLSAMVQQHGMMTAGDVTAAFVAANRKTDLPASSVAVRVGSRNALQEVYICYDLNFRYTRCTMGATPAGQKIWVQRPDRTQP